MKIVIDRFEGEYAVLIDDSMNAVNVPRSAIAENAEEGDCLILNGDKYERDIDHGAAEKARIKSKFDRLKKRL